MTVIGTLDFRDWDAGCMLTLGAEIVKYSVDGSLRSVYACDIGGIDSGFGEIDGKVPCHFVNPEDVYQKFTLPSFSFRRNDMVPAFNRQPWYQFVARGPAKDAKEVRLADGTVGYDRYENQFRAHPFDISYDCNIHARRKQDAAVMLKYALRHFLPPSFIFKVIDSKRDIRHYDAVDVNISNISELVDIADRVIGYTISFVARAEVDLYDDRIYPAMLERVVAYEQFRPNKGVV